MHSPQLFKPTVNVSVLALQNLTSIPFLRFTLRINSPTVSHSRVAARAKWLEHGVGPQVALPAAALSLLAHHLPAALTSLIRPPHAKPPSKPGRISPPNPSTVFLWVFGAHSVISAAKDLLSDAFTVEEQSVWTAASSPVHTHALTTAIHRAIVLALQAQGALRSANQVIHPDTGVSYTFSVSLTSPPEPQIIVRVAVERSKARRITDQDLLQTSKFPLPVFTIPLGTPATLSSRPPAGDALSESVLSRWREAGMIPSTPQSPTAADETVVFVQFDNGLEFPFPRAVILTCHPSVPLARSFDQSKSPSPTRKNSRINLWKSRKRPRSPSPDIASSGATGLVQNEPAKPAPSESPTNVLVNDAPTAESLNVAIMNLRQNGQEDPIPVLRNPLALPIYPPSFDFPSDDKPDVEEVKQEPAVTDPEVSVDKTETQAKAESTIAHAELHGGTGEDIAPLDDPSTKEESASEGINPSTGLDQFPMESHVSHAADFFDTGGPMVIPDFPDCVDVTELFSEGIDDRIQVESNALLEDELPEIEYQNATESSAVKSAGEANSDQDLDKQVWQDSKMDVDSAPNDQNSSQTGNDTKDSFSLLQILSPSSLVRSALSDFTSPLKNCRPSDLDVKKKLNSFLEEDFTERRRMRLSTSTQIAKKRQQSKLYRNPYTVQMSRFIRGHGRASRVTEVFEGQLSNSTDSDTLEVGRHRKSLYLPRRKVQAFSKLLRRTETVPSPFVLRKEISVGNFESDDEEEFAKQDCSKKAFSAATALSLLELDRDVNHEKPSIVNAPNERPFESDALKIADSVAIDCASICYVLATDRIAQASITASASEQPNAISMQGSPTGIKEEDPKHIGTVHLGPNASKGLPPHPATKIQIPAISSSPGGRSASRREGELNNVLSLLEMQLFSMRDLSLFRESLTDAVDVQQKEKLSDPESGLVSSATMRRVLLGLPRTFETSHIFRACFESLRNESSDLNTEVGNNGLSCENDQNVVSNNRSPSILGPLSINQYMGRSSAVFPLHPPQVCIGLDKRWVETNGGALPTWEKAGFEPYSLSKNVEYVALAPKAIEEDSKLFLGDVSSAYEECSFGKHKIFAQEDIVFIASPRADAPYVDRSKQSSSLSEAERLMVDQYQLQVTALCMKLSSSTREHRKNRDAPATNIVAYVISPFERKQAAANVALIRAVAPLVNAVPGAVPSGIGATPSIPNLPVAPWRASESSRGVVSVTVRIIPREVVDRNLSGPVRTDRQSCRSLRPQLMKAVSFAVFNSIRRKRVRIPSIDAEVANVLSRAALLPDDLMSPMTPDIVTDSSGSAIIAPVSPLGANADENVAHNGNMHTAPHVHVGYVDQSCALSPSFLHEPAIVLGGVGKHMGQTTSSSDIVLHLAYTFCDISSRYVFAWTDQRGELLDVATVPITRTALISSRRKAFWGMWARGQRWRVPHVEEVHATVSRLGTMAAGELDDWDWVIGKVMSSKSSLSEKRSDEDNGVAVVRRFPPQFSKADDLGDVYTDQPTPATPGATHLSAAGTSAKSSQSMDVKMPPVCSVTVLTICNLETHLFLEDSGDCYNSNQRDFAIVGRERVSRGKNVQASAVMARLEDEGVRALEVNIFRHYGNAGQSEEMSDERSPWDSFDVQTITSTIISNFHELRYACSPPSWPERKWLCMYPIHADAIRRYQSYLRLMHRSFPGNGAVGVR